VVEHSDQVTVIVLNFNKKEETLKCLHSVLKLDYPSFKVVLVDNGSTDGSPEAISQRYPKIHLVKSSTNLGASGGRNLGLRYVTQKFNFRYILFLDNDTVVDRGCLSQLVAGLQMDPEAGIACPKAYQDSSSNRIMSAGIVVNLYTASIYDIGTGKIDQGQFDKQRYVHACGGFGFLVRREVVSQLEGFDEVFSPYSWEDVDFCLRANKLRYKTLYIPPATLVHKGGKIGRGVVPMYERYKARNFVFLMRKHGNLIQKLSCLLWVPIKASWLIAKGLVQGNRSIGLIMAKGLWDATINRKDAGKS
jgi:GT2 family glycosyltransferase